jgi:hypothetical protein
MIEYGLGEYDKTTTAINTVRNKPVTSHAENVGFIK